MAPSMAKWNQLLCVVWYGVFAQSGLVVSLMTCVGFEGGGMVVVVCCVFVALGGAAGGASSKAACAKFAESKSARIVRPSGVRRHTH